MHKIRIDSNLKTLIGFLICDDGEISIKITLIENHTISIYIYILIDNKGRLVNVLLDVKFKN